MRKLAIVLGMFVVSGGLVSISLADQKADVARVEKELRAAQEAVAIYSRAKERAERAVSLSSLGQKYRTAQMKYKKMMRGEKVEGIPSRITKNVGIYAGKYLEMVKKMTRIFLDDEIKLAEERKLHSLMRELKKLLDPGKQI